MINEFCSFLVIRLKNNNWIKIFRWSLWFLNKIGFSDFGISAQVKALGGLVNIFVSVNSFFDERPHQSSTLFGFEISAILQNLEII